MQCQGYVLKRRPVSKKSTFYAEGWFTQANQMRNIARLITELKAGTEASLKQTHDDDRSHSRPSGLFEITEINGFRYIVRKKIRHVARNDRQKRYANLAGGVKLSQ